MKLRLIASVLLLLLLISFVKGGDIFLGWIDGASTRTGSEASTQRRVLLLREHPPNLDSYAEPGADYLTSADGLTAQKFRFRTDEDGFITGPLRGRKPVDIVFIGGSTTECLYVSEDKRFPYLVSQILTKSLGREVRSLNGGVSGNHTLHTLLYSIGKILKYQPKFVVLMENVNDLSLLSKSANYWQGPKTRQILQNEPVAAFTTMNGLLTANTEYLLPNISRRVLTMIGGRTAIDEFAGMRSAPPLPVDELAKRFHASLTGNVVLLKAWGIQPVLMTQFNRIVKSDEFIRTHYGVPDNMPFDRFADYYAEFNQVIRRVASEQGAYLIDLDALVPKSNKYIYDAVHLNDIGSEFVARQVADALRDKFLEPVHDLLSKRARNAR